MIFTENILLKYHLSNGQPNLMSFNKVIFFSDCKETTFCCFCGTKGNSNIFFISSHIHSGCIESERITLIEEGKYDCSGDYKEGQEYRNKYLQSICRDCKETYRHSCYQKNVLYQYCILCSRLTDCPCCKVKQLTSDTHFCEVQNMVYDCNTCGECFAPALQPYPVRPSQDR